MADRIPLRDLLTHPKGVLICWPIWDAETAERRIEELGRLGVRAIIFEGPHVVETIPVIGKGNTSIVLKAVTNEGLCAAKIRRTDADRVDFEEEGRLLGVANSIGIGPKVYRWGRWSLLMELIEGPYLSEWVRGLGLGDAKILTCVIRELVKQARKMDEAGLDHGELVRLRRHTMIRGFEPVIIDFESASTSRRVANVTTVIQSLFLNNTASTIIGSVMGLPNRDELLEALRAYKRDMSEGNFCSLLRVAGLGKDFRILTEP
ncbi:MAG: serine/threonine protein kinase [Candidatus Bathyarchaeia archaeon]